MTRNGDSPKRRKFKITVLSDYIIPFTYGIVFGLKISQAPSKTRTRETTLCWTDGKQGAAADMCRIHLQNCY